MLNNNGQFKGAIVPLGVDLRPYDEGRPVEEHTDPRDHTNRRNEFVSLGMGCRKARRLPTLS